MAVVYITYSQPSPDDDEPQVGGVREPRRPKPRPWSGSEAVQPDRETESVEAEGVRLTA